MADDNGQTGGPAPAPTRELREVAAPETTLEADRQLEVPGTDAKRDRERAANRASRIRRDPNATDEDRAWLASYEAQDKRRKPRKLRDSPEPVREPEHYRGGRRVHAAPQAPAAPASCGDPDCWRCQMGGRTCSVTGKPIYPPPPIAECETYAKGMIVMIGKGVEAATGVQAPAPQQGEVDALAKALQTFIHRRIPSTGKYTDIAAMLVIPASIGVARYAYSAQVVAEHKATVREQRAKENRAGDASPAPGAA